jgi:YfiH family protein
VAEVTGATHVYMSQVHGDRVLKLDAQAATGSHTADAAWTDQPGLACTVMVADCLPVLLAAPQGKAVGAAHAGWRGLAGGVVERTVEAVCQGASCEPHELVAWLGPCIGPEKFEVGADVLQAFGAEPKPAHSARFRYQPRADGQARWRADLAGLARDRLAAIGVQRVSGGAWCTVSDRSHFFSFRRDGVTGRMAASVWIRG